MCNGVAVYEINKFIVPYFKRRNQRSALINVTSCTGVYWTDGAANYPSIKHLIDLYTRTMALENS